MFTALVLAVTVAVAQPAKVTLFQIPDGQQLASWAIPERIFGLFAAPDGAVWVPLAEVAQTLILRQGFPPERVDGRYVPLFFREADRFYAFFSGELVMLAHPERVVIDRWPLPPLPGVRFANCSPDGRAVVLLTSGTPPRILTIYPFLGGTAAEQIDPKGWALFKFAVGNFWLAVASRTGVALSQLGRDGSSVSQIPGEVVDLAFSDEEKSLYVLAATPASALFRLAVPRKINGKISAKAIWLGKGEPKALAWCQEGILVLEDGNLYLVHPRGKAFSTLPLKGGTALAVLRGGSSVPRWSDVGRQ